MFFATVTLCVKDGLALSPPVRESIATFPTNFKDGKVCVQL